MTWLANVWLEDVWLDNVWLGMGGVSMSVHPVSFFTLFGRRRTRGPVLSK